MSLFKEYKIEDLVINYDKLRKPLSSRERERMKGKYPYYGATSIIDYVNEYIFDDDYILLGEDGTVINNDGTPILQKISGKCWVNNHAHVLKNTNIIDIDYLYYALKNTNVSGAVTGAVQPKISQANMNAIIIQIHDDKNDQMKVVRILKTIDDKIELNNKINKNLELHINQLFSHYFINTECQTWNTIPLENIVYFQEGPGIRNWQYTNEGVKFINIRCINNNDINLTTANMISAEEANSKYSHFLLKPYDIVMSCSGTLGRYAIVRKKHLPLCLNTSIIRFYPKELEDYGFIFSYLTSNLFLNMQQYMANGSAQINFGPTHLKQIQIKEPPTALRKKYNSIVMPLINTIIINLNENDALTYTKNSLLPKLMSGEIDVSKVDI